MSRDFIVQAQVIKREAPFVQVGSVVTIVGKDGSLIYSAAGVPSNTLGVYTDLYIDTVAPNNFYQKNASNIWVLKGSLKGADGKGIVSFEIFDVQEKTKTYRLLYTDATYQDIPIIDGNDGVDGLTPYIGINGNWWIGDVDQNIKAEGVDGISPTIGLNGNWYLGAVDTVVKAQGDDGYTPIKGVDYFDGITPTIGENKHWFIGAIDTGIVAEGKDGEDGVTPIITIGENENWYINGVDSGKPSRGADGTGAYEIYHAGGGTLSEAEFNESITNIPTHIEDATKHIDTTTAEFSGTIDETNDKLTIWDNSLLKWIRFSFTSLKEYLSTFFQQKNLLFTNTQVLTGSWVADTTYANYGYKCDLELTGVTATMIAEVIYSHAEAISGNYSPIAVTGAGIVTIYSKVNTTITIPTILINKQS